MAYITLPRPGTEHGPCEENCGHRDCKAARKDAAKTCRICKKPIGYETAFFKDNQTADGLVHASCLMEEIDKQREAKE